MNAQIQASLTAMQRRRQSQHNRISWDAHSLTEKVEAPTDSKQSAPASNNDATGFFEKLAQGLCVHTILPVYIFCHLLSRAGGALVAIKTSGQLNRGSWQEKQSNSYVRSYHNTLHAHRPCFERKLKPLLLLMARHCTTSFSAAPPPKQTRQMLKMLVLPVAQIRKKHCNESIILLLSANLQSWELTSQCFAGAGRELPNISFEIFVTGVTAFACGCAISHHALQSVRPHRQRLYAIHTLPLERRTCLWKANTSKEQYGTHASQCASCMTTRSFVADVDPKAILVELKTLLSVANTSDHFTPSDVTPTENDFAGNSQAISRSRKCLWPPRSTVTVTGPAGSNALACKTTTRKPFPQKHERKRCHPESFRAPIHGHVGTMCSCIC